MPDFPFGFWLSLVMVIGLAIHAWNSRRAAWGIPTMAVCGTVAVWYHGDAISNWYGERAAKFSSGIPVVAWWQVVGFVMSLAILAPFVHRQMNSPKLGRRSNVVALLSGQDTLVRLQTPLAALFRAIVIVWMILSVVGIWRTNFDFLGFFTPWLGHLASPWGRGRFGGGMDFLLALAGYVNLFCLAGFGVVAALTKSRQHLVTALICIALSWPTVLLDRARNPMLAIVLPGLLCLVLVRFRGRRMLQGALLLSALMATSFWFSFVMAHRTRGSISSAFAAGKAGESTRMGDIQGLNMFEELCWINMFLQNGTYTPNWGERYFAEAVNPIPRSFWPGKPSIGLDYAVARGQQDASGVKNSVYATVSTGMIGQGVVNFGPWGGPPAAALLISVWVAVLARFDLMGYRIGRLPLYVLGLVLTFNLGRDITLLVAYPLLFGYAIVRSLELRGGVSRQLPPHQGNLGGRARQTRYD